LLAGAAMSAHPAFAADALKFGAPPAWVHPQPIPASKPTQAPVSLLLNDQQTYFEHGKVTTFSEGAVKIENAQGLAAGNVALVWQPATDTVTINKLQIRRGDKIIDVLAGGQTFTVLRRETNLDAATLDGTLTATLQPEGLQAGDIIDLATTTERSDPVLKGHVETVFGAWDGLPIQSAHAAISWPSDLHLQIRETPNLPPARRSSANGVDHLELSAENIQPLIPPKGAPERFLIGRLAETTDFTSWSDIADLFMPLYKEASAIPSSGPLHDEVEKIRTASANPKTRAEQALALVQSRIRYVALLMGQGGLVPATAETTWSRRFGDCKAKTALLLGILHSLGIEAEPVLAQVKLGDMVADRLPMVALFNHVLVRAHIGGKDYWLDGTRAGDTDLDSIEVPDFGWGLPLVQHAALVKMVPAPLTSPSLERHIAIDASSGVLSTASITIDETYRGDPAVGMNRLYSAATPQQRDEALHNEAKNYFDDFAMASSSVQFDEAKRELHMSMKGTATLNWKDGWLFVPTSSIGFDPDFERTAGALHDAPMAVSHPSYTKDEATIRLPPGFAAQQKLDTAVHETLAGVEYARSETVNGDVLTVDSSERSLVPEVPYKDALAAASRLRALNKDDVYLDLPNNYRATEADLNSLQKSTPASADEYFRRADAYLSHGKVDDALSDLSAGLQLEPKDVSALGKRIFIYTQKRDFDSAEKDIATVQSVDPTNPAIPGAQAMVAESKGDFQACVAGYSKLLERQPSQGFALTHRAMCESSLGKDDVALADAAAALKSNPHLIDLRVLRANLYMHEGKRDLVSAEAETMTKDNPTSDFAWVAAAKTYAAIDQRDKAMQAFDRALAIKPLAYIYVNRSEVRPKSDVKGKIADLDEALKLEPTNPSALAEKAQLLSESGDSRGALALIDKINSAMGPGLGAFAEAQRATILRKAGRTAEADKLYADLETKAKSPGELNNLCYDQATEGIRLDAALRDCRQALKGSPDNGAYLDSLGMVLLKLGKLDEALDAYNAAIAKGSTGPDTLMGRAFVYLRKGDRAHAQADAAAARKASAHVDETFAKYGLKFDDSASKKPEIVSVTKN